MVSRGQKCRVVSDLKKDEVTRRLQAMKKVVIKVVISVTTNFGSDRYHRGEIVDEP